MPQYYCGYLQFFHANAREIPRIRTWLLSNTPVFLHAVIHLPGRHYVSVNGSEVRVRMWQTSHKWMRKFYLLHA
jgi:hypothetical protein